MNKLLWLLPIAFLAACGGEDKKKEEEQKPDAPLVKSKNSTTFNNTFDKVVADYFHLKDGFVLSTDVPYKTVDLYASLLTVHLDSIPWTELKADPAIVETAKSSAKGIASELMVMKGVKGVEEKRKSFQMVSDQMYDLIRTVQYDKKLVYHDFCPMAFNNVGAYWLSDTSAIANPYFGSKMFDCGEIKDSLDFRVK